MTIKLFDVQTENAIIKKSFFQKFEELYDSGNFTLGFSRGPVEELEELWKNHCSRKYALALGAGTHALHMASYALGLKPGDEVIVPANTFIATALAPAFLGATIVECDVDAETLNLNRSTVEKVLTPKTKAIFSVNLYGNPAPYEELKALKIPLVEDAAHSHGAEYFSQKSGCLGDYSAFSFFPTKVVGGIGDSGMLLFDAPEMEIKLRAFRNGGQDKPHHASVMGNVYRMHVLQAQFLVEKWKIFQQVLEHRRQIAAVYDELFKDTPVRPQQVLQGCKSSYFAYVIRIPHREKVVEKLLQAKVPTTIQYRYLLHEQAVTSQIYFRASEAPEASRALKEILSLPLNFSVSKDQAAFVAEKVLNSL
ncbi:MAG: DegT/DnrJ/EryC1/StrS family aminotransferase [Deltaproteobacteria bacterium]|nr:DegT/DnrJ/EryC1/StrS family aminotransferase [Deltaproteobacteria bacterium]